MNIKYRRAKESDAEEIGFVLKECYNIKDVDEGKETFLSELEKGHNFVVSFSETGIIGIASWIIHGLPKHGLAELDRIGLLPEFRGKGVSKFLFEFLFEDIKKYYKEKGYTLRKLYLLTHEDNMRAQEFYKVLGFSYEVTLKDHYYKGKGEWLMSIFFD
ncbi:MAG: GNAT family N-acetyltransferase [Candidatus Aenigmarchaeota archaeon]|nr:GNAT family N-acetyltransferase [Candidatus Aenigmarchaeota archaeon]